MEALFINVKQLVAEVSESEDDGLAGLYQVTFNVDVSAIPTGYQSGMALDIFHTSHGIAMLEDFEITVVTKDGTLVNAPDDYDEGKHADDGDVEKVSDEAF